jgi:ethanolamine utilization protein EutN
MNVGRVVGHVISTVKDPNLTGYKILCVEPLNGRERPFFALDAVGAGAGEVVLYCRQREASYAFHPLSVPCDGAVVGIVDELHEVLP